MDCEKTESIGIHHQGPNEQGYCLRCGEDLHRYDGGGG